MVGQQDRAMITRALPDELGKTHVTGANVPDKGYPAEAHRRIRSKRRKRIRGVPAAEARVCDGVGRMKVHDANAVGALAIHDRPR